MEIYNQKDNVENDKCKIKIVQYGAQYDQFIQIEIYKSRINTLKQFKDCLRPLIKYSNLDNVKFVTENGLEIDEYYIRTALINNEILFVVPGGTRFHSFVKRHRFEFLSEYKRKDKVVISLAKDVLNGVIYYVKKIECATNTLIGIYLLIYFNFKFFNNYYTR